MKRTPVFFALLLTAQVFASALVYAGGYKNGTYYPGGEMNENGTFFLFLPFQALSDYLFPPKEVIKAPPVGPIGGKESNAPNWFSCSGKKGMKLVMDGSVARRVFCD